MAEGLPLKGKHHELPDGLNLGNSGALKLSDVAKKNQAEC
jgi:hypothetical protein